MKHNRLVKLCKTAAAHINPWSPMSLSFLRQNPHWVWENRGGLHTSNVDCIATLLFWPYLGRDFEPNPSNCLVCRFLVQVSCSWTSSYFCAFDLQDVPRLPSLEFIFRPSHGWGHFAVASQKLPHSKSVWCSFGSSAKFPEQDVLD